MSTLVKMMEREHQKYTWNNVAVYLEQKKKYELELLANNRTFDDFETGDVILIDIGKSQAIG